MTKTHMVVEVKKQTLTLFCDDKIERVFRISTAKNGIGQQENSGCTPLGKHKIAAKFGENLPMNAVLVGRVFTGEIYDETLGRQYPDRDWILTRILWLDGLEDGINRGENADGVCDTYRRYIYIHGTPDTEPMGVPLSHGCIRMRNDEVYWLFDRVRVGDEILISN